MRPLVVLRPEPGNAATCARIAAAGGTAIALPLFAVATLPWTPPDPANFDGLLLTSANAVRHAGPALARYRSLPVLAVGATTAAAARAAGLSVHVEGDSGITGLAPHVGGYRRLLHLAGRDRTAEHLPQVAATIAIYASDAIVPSADALTTLSGSVALLHSQRAARRLAELAPDRAAVRLAAISPAALAAAGDGWAGSASATDPTDVALVPLAMRLAD